MSEKTDTQGFKSVDSFSELPFLRPPSSGIRLFGFQVPQEAATPTAPEPCNEDPRPPTGPTTTTSGRAGPGPDQAGRKFECHYCCRNFPTSQALGGHQNAHKRERQHAKRSHLQSAIAAAHHSHYALAAGHRSVYGVPNYPHRVAASWHVGPRAYGGLGSVAQPINGSPLPGIWRVPAGGNVTGFDVRDYRHVQGGLESLPVPVQLVQSQGSVGYLSPMTTSSSSSSSLTLPFSSSRALQSQMVCEVKENVSLDLHL